MLIFNVCFPKRQNKLKMTSLGGKLSETDSDPETLQASWTGVHNRLHLNKSSWVRQDLLRAVMSTNQKQQHCIKTNPVDALEGLCCFRWCCETQWGTIQAVQVKKQMYEFEQSSDASVPHIQVLHGWPAQGDKIQTPNFICGAAHPVQTAHQWIDDVIYSDTAGGDLAFSQSVKPAKKRSILLSQREDANRALDVK